MSTESLSSANKSLTSSSQKRIFISYSRSEMYYAEALTLGLQRAGFDVWFDLQQLEPGCIWLEEIAKGLQSCDELILVVSRSALTSPWVTKEWQYALDNNKPVHLVLFEAVNFHNYTMSNEAGEDITVDTQPLYNQALSVIDGLSNFDAMMNRLVMTLQGDLENKDTVPVPNQWGLPTRLPMMLMLVGFGMLFMIGFLLWLAFEAFTIFIPAAIGSLLLAFLGVRELYQFLTRQSFRGTRFSLLLTSVISFLFFPPLTLLFVLTWLASIFSLDVNRWSPRGEGARRGETSNRVLLGQLFGQSLSIYQWFAKKFIVFKLLVLILVSLVAAIFSLIIPSSDRIQSLLFVPSYIIVLTIVASWITPLLQRKEEKTIIEANGKRFHMIHNFVDATSATLINDMLVEMGYESVSRVSETVDYHFIIATDRLEQRDFSRYQGQEGRWIVLVMSNLEQQAWFKDLEAFQWVDFRKQDREQLTLMVDELSKTDYDIISHSFSTRTTPQSFTKVVLPRSVQLYVVLQIVVLNTALGITVVNALRTTKWTMAVIISLLMSFIASFISIFITVRVMRRDITIGNIVTINTISYLVIYFVNTFAALMQPPEGMQVDINQTGMNIGVTVVAAITGYFIGGSVLNGWLGHWLPQGDAQNGLFNIAWRRNYRLYARSIIMAVIVIFLVASFVGTDAATTPIADLLRQSNTPIGNGVADFISSLLP